MNIEKLVNSQFFKIFEWFYRLIFLNILIFATSFSLASIPFFIFYYNRDLGIYVLLAIVLFIPLFILAFFTSFIVIKHYIENKTGNVFILYFRYFLDTVKKTYLIIIIITSVFFITIYGIYYYWQLLSPENFRNDLYGYFSVIAFVIEFFVFIFLVSLFINIAFIIAYFRMKQFDYVKLAFRFSIKNMIQTLLAFIILLIPLILLYLFKMKFLPIYFIIGVSLPQMFINLLIRKRFNYLEKNIDEIYTEEKYE